MVDKEDRMNMSKARLMSEAVSIQLTPEKENILTYSKRWTWISKVNMD